MVVETLVASSPLNSSASKFYGIFKNKTTDIASIYPASIKEIEVVEGELGTLGCVARWNFIVGGAIQTLKLESTEIDDVGRSITFTVIEGDLLVLYKSFKFILDVVDGLAKVTIAYEKATLLSPPPEKYVPLSVAMFTHIDHYLLINN